MPTASRDRDQLLPLASLDHHRLRDSGELLVAARNAVRCATRNVRWLALSEQVKSERQRLRRRGLLPARALDVGERLFVAVYQTHEEALEGWTEPARDDPHVVARLSLVLEHQGWFRQKLRDLERALGAGLRHVWPHRDRIAGVGVQGGTRIGRVLEASAHAALCRFAVDVHDQVASRTGAAGDGAAG